MHLFLELAVKSCYHIERNTCFSSKYLKHYIINLGGLTWHYNHHEFLQAGYRIHLHSVVDLGSLGYNDGDRYENVT